MRFARALQLGVLIDRAWFELMTTRHVRRAPSLASGYGYGATIDEENGVTSWGTGTRGHRPGTQFEFKAFPVPDAILIVMSNYDTIAPSELASSIGNILRAAPEEDVAPRRP